MRRSCEHSLFFVDGEMAVGIDMSFGPGNFPFPTWRECRVTHIKSPLSPYHSWTECTPTIDSCREACAFFEKEARFQAHRHGYESTRG